MLRSFLIYLSKAAWARRIVTHWKIAWRAASRFVAGETAEDGIRVVKTLNAKGIYATLDVLGEHTYTIDAAQKSTQDVIQVLDAIHASGVKSNVSIKLTQLGMAVDLGVCEENLRQILTHARELNNFVRIDMEDSPWTDTTLGLYQKMRDEGLDNTGVVIQSYLYRSEKDIHKAADECTRVRLCKGTYKEPADVAFPKKADVDASYDKLVRIMLEGTCRAGLPQVTPDGHYPALLAVASHDPRRLEFAKKCAQEMGIPKRAVEFQMLNGIRRDLQDQTAAEGYPVRIYVPFGTEWYPYFMRRLAERPANLWFFISNYFRK